MPALATPAPASPQLLQAAPHSAAPARAHQLPARTQALPSEQQQEEDAATAKLDSSLHLEPHPHPTPDGRLWDWNHSFYPVVRNLI